MLFRSLADNHIIALDLMNSRFITFLFEAVSDFSWIAVSDDGRLLFAADSTDKARVYLISVPSRVESRSRDWLLKVV